MLFVTLQLSLSSIWHFYDTLNSFMGSFIFKSKIRDSIPGAVMS